MPVAAREYGFLVKRQCYCDLGGLERSCVPQALNKGVGTQQVMM